jgi:flagellar basal-body rod modification protein FlgD
MGSNSMADIAGLLGAGSGFRPENSTSRKNNTELDMQDFLQLMIVQLQNQTIDDTMDTSEMMNQMIQMQMITAMSNMTETSVQSYASSLVGKVVTIGIVTDKGLEEREVIVTGTGVMNGQQVIFGKDSKGNIETYGLNQIMAVGQLPPIEKPDEDEKPGEGEGEGDGSVDGPGEGEGADKPEGGEPTPPAEGSGGTETNPQYQGEQGAPTD